MEKRMVLLVDDDRDFLESVKTIFEANGFNVETAFDGEAGLRKAKRMQPDLIVLDVMLPKKDGFSVCHDLKDNERTASIPILMMTSLGNSTEGKGGAELLAAGHKADGYLEKPVEPQVLVEKAKELIQGNGENGNNKKLKVLLIDDDPDFVAAVKTLLDANGYRTIIAYTGEDGLVSVQKENPDIVLLDVMLPQKDGFSVCKELKEDEKTRFIPVIMLTSIAEKLTEPEYAKAMAVTHKADDYMEKPVEQKELLKRIRRFIGPMRRLV